MDRSYNLQVKDTAKTYFDIIIKWDQQIWNKISYLIAFAHV